MAQRIALFCVGNRLMLDDGLGPAVYDELLQRGCLPSNVDAFDLGCLTLAQVDAVHDYDYLICVDAVDESGQPAGTVLKWDPYDLQGHSGPTASLHELMLRDLFDAAALLGYEAQGLCLGMQVENGSPDHVVEGLTPPVMEALPLLVDVVLGEINRINAQE